MRHFAVLLFFLGPILAGRGAEFAWSAPALESGREVSLRLWVPDEVKAVKEVIVLVPGRNGDGRPMAADREWRALAKRWKCALLACKLTGESYQIASVWSGSTILKGLRELGQSAQQPELDKAALLFFGHSNGGHMATSFLDWRPDQVAAFVVVNGNTDRVSLTEAKCRAPSLWILGENDSDEVREFMVKVFSRGRRLGAPWAFAIQPGAGHELGNARSLAIEFFDAVFRARQTSGDQAAPWVGDFRTHETSPVPPGQSNAKLNAWLLDERFARKWRDFVTGTKSAPEP